jgi:hypothetical protein
MGLLGNKDYIYAIVKVKSPRSDPHAVYCIAQHSLTNNALNSHNA